MGMTREEIHLFKTSIKAIKYLLKYPHLIITQTNLHGGRTKGYTTIQGPAQRYPAGGRLTL